ncbi:MAG: hypothetical protein GTN59_11695 [Candidatus Dadabacteria bacterium]|nr:hypothetical protein [Candidatus Dadabacteria bacterium]
MVERILNEDLPRRERERHATQFAKASFEPYDREREIMNAFGPYRDDVPANVVSYLRKNPRMFLKRLTAVYGMDKMLDFIGYEVPADAYDNHMGDDETEWAGNPPAEDVGTVTTQWDDWMEDDMCEECGMSEESNTWPKKLKKGRFTTYCKREGFSGPSKACANYAMDSDDESVRGMASFYLNTVKP